MKVTADFMQDPLEAPHILIVRQYEVETSADLITTIERQLALAATIWPILSQYRLVKEMPLTAVTALSSVEVASSSKDASTDDINSGGVQGVNTERYGGLEQLVGTVKPDIMS